ncbi:MAG TPA: hypothetical protein VMG10_08035 [Gemmataceae bacterium]|nr:hypothetical protein [Gemmataceae bacterium]
MKRLLAVIVCGALLLSIVVGCGKDNKASYKPRPDSVPPIAKGQNPPGSTPTAAKNTAPAVTVKPDKEGMTWKSTDLLNYLRGQGVKFFAFGEPFNFEDDAEAKKTLVEMFMLTDDESAAARAPKKRYPVEEAMDQQKKGIGVIGLTHYHSAADTQGLRPGDESSLAYGRFGIHVVDPQPKGSGKESGNLRSRKLIQQIRKALGLPVVSVEWPPKPATPAEG